MALVSALSEVHLTQEAIAEIGKTRKGHIIIDALNITLGSFCQSK